MSDASAASFASAAEAPDWDDDLEHGMPDVDCAACGSHLGHHPEGAYVDCEECGAATLPRHDRGEEREPPDSDDPFFLVAQLRGYEVEAASCLETARAERLALEGEISAFRAAHHPAVHCAACGAGLGPHAPGSYAECSGCGTVTLAAWPNIPLPALRPEDVARARARSEAAWTVVQDEQERVEALRLHLELLRPEARASEDPP